MHMSSLSNVKEEKKKERITGITSKREVDQALYKNTDYKKLDSSLCTLCQY